MAASEKYPSMKRPKGGFEIALPAASVVPIKKMGSAMLPVWDLGIQQLPAEHKPESRKDLSSCCATSIIPAEEGC